MDIEGIKLVHTIAYSILAWFELWSTLEKEQETIYIFVWAEKP